MKALIFIYLMTIATLFAAVSASAECDCRQPAYRDQIDFITQYMVCLDDCLNDQLQQIRLDIQRTDQRLSDMQEQIDGLNLKIKRLEVERSSSAPKK